MDVFKNFLKKKKVEKHFKKTGPGQRLDSSSSAPIPSVVAGAAQAQRELEEERRRNDPKYALEQLGLEEKKYIFSWFLTGPGPDVREFEHADVIKGVYFTCELLGDDEAMTKPELMGALEEFLISQLSCNDEDAVVPAVLLLYSLNKKQPKEERVASVKGGREFLNSVGFEERMEPFKEGDAPEPFLVMPESAANNTGRLVGALEMLRDGQSVPIKVSRDTSIFALRENERVPVPRVPPDFYDLTADEIRREQQNRTEELNRVCSIVTFTPDLCSR
ncbi:hypothetical protein ANCCEY_09443 [Ancylostoma ceylanicum]|uniref:Uncharacterized protein n=1 Tax=Ancylostoma ceylanicum TaxID=53326 RepID=A0A0D6LHB2_9BILA|nr:hypothetical protein ANCCEY_09443 [Ancylostoma ceylanicum]